VTFEEAYAPLERVFAVRAFPLDGGGISVFFRDVTDERRASADLATANSMLASIGEAAPDLLFAKDRKSRMLNANPATLAVIGRTPDNAWLQVNDGGVLGWISTTVIVLGGSCGGVGAIGGEVGGNSVRVRAAECVAFCGIDLAAIHGARDLRRAGI